MLRDFNKGSIEDLETKYRLSQKNFGASVSKEMLAAFRYDPGRFGAPQNQNENPFEDLQWPGEAARHKAAALIQSRVRGFLVRRDTGGLKSRLLFRRLTTKADALSRDMVVRTLVRALRLAHQGLKERK